LTLDADEAACRRRRERLMKVYISVDFEGVSGIVAWEQAGGQTHEYQLGRELVLGETNAAIEGALSAGAAEVVVNDSHAAMRNLDLARLAGRATYISGRYKPLYMMQGLDGSFDAVFFVGYHSAVGAAAVLSHTYNPESIWEVRLNGEVTGEAGINALVAQACGVPVVLLTGDGRSGEEARRFLPHVRTVETKRSVSRFAAENLHPETARELVREGAAVALAGAASADPRPIPVPARLDVTFLTEDMAEMATWVSGVECSAPRAVALEDADPLALYRRFVAVLYMTQTLRDR
jgi:D-amino peptidase